MNTLVVSPFLPYPLVFGGAIRLYHLIKMLGTFSEVDLLTYRSWTDRDATSHLETLCRRVVVSDAKPRETRLRRVQSLASRHSYQHRAHGTHEFQRELDRLVHDRHYDVVLVEMSPMGQFDLPSGALRVLDLQNIEHELLERRAATASNALRRVTLGLEARKVRKEELDNCRRFDLLFTPSDRETAILRGQGARRVETLVNTVDTRYFAPPLAPADPGPRLAFVGTTHVDANREGLRYFMAEVYPLIREQMPDVELDIVGGDPPHEVRAFGSLPGVTVTGYVKDVREYMARARALIVPLRSGGGTRLKILEGLAFGSPTVSTSVGAEGLGITPGEHILIGDDAHSFAEASLRLLQDADLRDRMCTAGRTFVTEHYDWTAQAGRLHSLLESSLADRGSATAA
jgi:polysaccharide biosynthesis protein PslH